ncbi:MAG TPA: pilus assembly protein TadG-related protein [Steroidobacteraceae bacterium]|nr:pilus assembly protein TadG-related protein [Steroidobacteraceae bacterium]
MKRRNRRPAPPRAQRGISLVLITIAITALILMSGLALDISHMMINKTRLQDTVDAAALAAANTLNSTSNTNLATASALAAMGLNASAAGNQELGASYTAGNITVTVEYSSALPPFTPGTAPAQYVRVKAAGFSVPAWLVRLAGITQLSVSASAVAGASPTVNTACNLAPMLVCGTTPSPAGTIWGFQPDAPQVLKSAAPGSSQLGPGNFQLVQLGGPGGNDLKSNMAGGYQACETVGNSDAVQTQTGNLVGPSSQGLDTRFGQYKGGLTESQYPPDVLTTGQSPELSLDKNGNIVGGSPATVIDASNINQLLYSYKQYTQDEGDPTKYQYQPVSSGGPGAFNRRVLSVVVGDCSGKVNGTSSIPIIGFACFFLLQPDSGGGNIDFIYGQFEGNCDVNGDPGPAPVTGPGPYIIELYHDPDSGDS